MKIIHSFTVAKDKQDIKFDIVAPSRSVAKESEMVYAKTYGNCIRNGLLSNAEISKISSERGGILTDQEKEEYSKLVADFFLKEQAINAKKEKNEEVPVSTDEATGESIPEEIEKGKKKRKHKDTTEELEVKALRERILGFQARQDAVFSQTADTKAREESIFFCTLFLTYKDGKMFFEGKNFEEKANKFDAESQSDKFLQNVFRKATWYVSAAQYGISDLSSFPAPEDSDV